MKLIESLLQARFTQSKHDHSLFIKEENGQQVIILVYVDDLLITGSGIAIIQEAKHKLHKAFKIKDLGNLKYFLGIEVCRSGKGILLQRKYALEVIAEL